MLETSTPKLASPAKRIICALLAIGGVAALITEIAEVLASGQLPSAGKLLTSGAAVFGCYIFGMYAIKGHG